MTLDDWRRLIDEGLAAGVTHVQFIGGEPTLHPDLPALVSHALARGLVVEVFSNLVRVPEPVWEVLALPRARLATSWYSPEADQHDAITGRRSHHLTLRNIREATRRSVPVRASVIGVRPGQDVDAAMEQLRELGVDPIHVDYARQIGRGGGSNRPQELCGRCGIGQVAISPTGQVWPCLLSGWIRLGDVREASLDVVYTHSADVRAALAASFSPSHRPCAPQDGGCGAPLCGPHTTCGPDRSHWMLQP